MLFRTTAIAIALVGICAPVCLRAESTADPTNLLVNGEFDTDLSGWRFFENEVFHASWSNGDHSGSLASGSTRIVNSSTVPHARSVGQCVPVEEGAWYVIKANVWVSRKADHDWAELNVFGSHTVDCSGTAHGNDYTAVTTTQTGQWVPLATRWLAQDGDKAALVALLPRRGAGSTEPLEVNFDGVSMHKGECVPGPLQLCLTNGRFAVKAFWKTRDGSEGSGFAVPLTSDSGAFWFFGPTNLEINVKVLDACGYNDRFWVFASGSTDVEVRLEVTDTMADGGKDYRSPLGQTFVTITDTNAFATCP